jgi:hypothetical protein
MNSFRKLPTEPPCNAKGDHKYCNDCNLIMFYDFHYYTRVRERINSAWGSKSVHCSPTPLTFPLSANTESENRDKYWRLKESDWEEVRKECKIVTVARSTL